jgi:glutamate formiminotransferase/formiminotetrahydrofolate cyclodeaminase
LPETYDQNHTIKAFLDAAAAKQPAPGGGSVAALAGALAASMGEMVVNYSVGKKTLAAYEADLQEALKEFHRARQLMLALMAEDQAGYVALTEMRKKLKDGACKPEHFDAALLASIRVPQAIGATAVAVIELADRMAQKVNHYLLSDLAVCAELAMATARCATYNVRVNLSDVKDAGERDHFERWCATLLSHGREAIQRAMPKIWSQPTSAS